METLGEIFFNEDDYRTQVDQSDVRLMASDVHIHQQSLPRDYCLRKVYLTYTPWSLPNITH